MTTQTANSSTEPRVGQRITQARLLAERKATRFAWLAGAALLLAAMNPIAQAAEAIRLYDGVTAFVDNSAGRDFTVTLDVQDINIYETGPREVLLKVYDPDGHAAVRRVIPDDGVTSKAFQPAMGAWDHEAWYYAYSRMQGAEPALRWSAFSSPDRLATIPKRSFAHKIGGGKKGVWRILVVGCLDHYVTLNIDPALRHGVAGHCDWLHGRGSQYQKSFLYVPKGAVGLHFAAAEFDTPRSRTFRLSDPSGATLLEAETKAGYAAASLKFEKPGVLDDQVLTMEIPERAGDFKVALKWRFDKDPEVRQRGERVVSAIFAPDAATAQALRGGAIYHDGRVFWQPFQVRFHEWLKRLQPTDLEVKDASGNAADPAPTMKATKPKGLVALPQNPNFIPLNGVHWQPPLCDHVMHHYSAHKNRAALNVALQDLAAGLRSIGPNDLVTVATAGPFANMAYEFGNYAWHYWRPAWRVLQQSDAPDEVKQIVREAMLTAGDRLAFCRSWERVNGNAFAQLVSALRYSYAATDDPLQKELFDVYFQRFANGGWGERVGAGPSGPIQEGFAYAYHYGSYIVGTWPSVLADFRDERMQRVHDRVRNWFSYTLADERIPAGAWSSRTHHYPEIQIETEGKFSWKGLPGPDFTETVNGGNEWFAARRQLYYALTYHGRLSPRWNSNAAYAQSGYGGGMLCQLHIPGRGPVLASTLNGEYGDHMHASQWRTFHLHSVVGQTVDGRPLVTADSEHFDAKLEGETVSSSGEVREQSVRIARSYSFGANGIECSLQLGETEYNEVLSLFLKNQQRGKLAEAYEMIPFVPNQIRQRGEAKPKPTTVTFVGPENSTEKELTTEKVAASAVIIDRGGFGVRIAFHEPQTVFIGEKNTVMVQLIEKPTAAREVSLKYQLKPFVNR